MTNPSEIATKLPSGLGSGKFLSTRRNTIALAGLAALAALGVLLLFMSNYRDSVKSGTAEVTVLVADRPIDEGTSGDVIAEAGLFKPTTITEDEALEGAISDPSAIRGQVATDDVYRGEQLTAAAFGAGADPIAGKLEGTQRALAVPLDAAHGNLGQIEEGSRVDVLGGTGGALARDVLVLRVAEEGSDSGDKRSVILRLSDIEASRVAVTSDQSDVWLTVRPPTLAKDSDVNASANAASIGKLLDAISAGG
jgi:Flp pilus assembly protein CpaB